MRRSGPRARLAPPGRPSHDARPATQELPEGAQQARLDAGVPGRILHNLRRTAVRNLERAGVPRSVAMKMVGHKTESGYRCDAIVDEAAAGLGTMWGEKVARRMLAEAGFNKVDVVDCPRPQCCVYLCGK